MLRVPILVMLATLLDSCGLTETGTAAAGAGAAQTQQAEQGRKVQEGLKRQIEEANRQAADAQGAAADAAAR